LQHYLWLSEPAFFWSMLLKPTSLVRDAESIANQFSDLSKSLSVKK